MRLRHSAPRHPFIPRSALVAQSMLRPRPENTPPQPLPDDTHAQADSRYAWGVCGFLLFAVGLIYGQTLGYGFLNYDDNGFVFANSHVRAGLTADGFRWAFTDGPYGEWYPLDPLSHMLDCQLFGLEAWGHHLTNVLLHAATSIALFLVLWRMTQRALAQRLRGGALRRPSATCRERGLGAERRDVLSGLLFVLTLGAYLGYVRHGRPLLRYLLVAVLFALGLMAKPMVVTLPPLLLLLDFWPLARIGSAIDTPGWTPIGRAARRVVAGVGKAAIGGARGGRLPDDTQNPRSRRPLAPLVGADRQCGRVVRHLRRSVCSIPSTWRHSIPIRWMVRRPGRWSEPSRILALASAAAVVWRRRFPYLLCRLVLVFGHVVSGARSRHDLRSRHGRSLHVSAWHWALHRPGLGGRADGRRPARRAPAAGRWRGCGDRRADRLRRVAGHVLARRGEPCGAMPWRVPRTTAKPNLGWQTCWFDKAGSRRQSLITTAQSRATEAAPYTNLGLLLARQGKLEEAIAQFKRGLELEPGSVVAQFNLGLVLLQQRRFDEAREHLDRAIQLDPSSVTAHCGLANLLRLEGKLDDARAEFERGIALNPNHLAAHNDLAAMLFEQGKFDESIPHFEAVLAIDPRYLPARLMLRVP